MNSGWNRHELLQNYKLHCERTPLDGSVSNDPLPVAQAFLSASELDLSTLGDEERNSLLNEMESIWDSCWAHALPEKMPNEQPATSPPFVGQFAESQSVDSQPANELGLPLRYRPLHKIGEGGLGQIWRVLDTRLNRHVAIKTPRDELARHPRLWDRLFREAELTSQLQHPGIPPTYDTGQLSTGVPFFSMKLIEGETLANLLREPLDERNRRLWLSRFSSLVQTIAFAHDRGVIHRDLKPHNVMVGEFGELQVMDWGLARAIRAPSSPTPETEDLLSSRTPPDATPRQSLPDTDLNDSSLTRVGEVLGTPHYMAPEQARGDAVHVGFASDVFSLGAILHEVLTGNRLYADFAENEVLAEAAQGPTASLLRLDDVDCDTTLKELVRHCLRSDPAARPANAGEISLILNAYFEERDERLRNAEAEQTRAQLRIEEERKRRNIAIGLVAVLLTGIGGTLWGLTRANSEWQRAEQNAATSESNAQIASTNAEFAIEKAALAERVVKNFYTRIGQEKLFDTPSLQPLRQELLDEALKFYVQATQEAPDDLPLRLAHGELLVSSATATFSRGEATSALDLLEQAKAKLQSVLDVATDSNPELPSPTRSGWTLADEARDYLGRALTFEGTARMRLGNPLACIALFGESERLYQRLVAEYPQDIFLQRNSAELYSAWGFFLTGSPRPEEALVLLDKALALRLQIVDSELHNEYDRHNLARSYWDIGYCQRLMSAKSVGEAWEGLLAKTIDNYQLSLGILEELSDEFPSSMAFQTTLGQVYNTMAVAYSHRNDRGVLSTNERAENNRLAIDAHQQSLATQARLVSQNPGIERLEFDLSRSYLNYGVQLKATARYEEAMEAYLSSLAIRRKIHQRRPQDLVYASGLANVLNNAALIQLDHLENTTSAMQLLIEAEEIYRGLIERAPDNRRLQMSLAAVYLTQGLVERKRQDWNNSAARLEKALATTAGESDQLLTIAKHASKLAELAALAGADSAPRLRERGIEILSQLVADGHIALVDLDHPDFQCLSDSPEFQACRETLSPAAPTL
jgi:serine/threonine protein kinase